MRSLAAPWFVTLVALVALYPRSARADPWFDFGDNALEDQYADGDFDEEDHVAMHLGGHVGSTDLHGESWVSLLGFTRQLLSGKNDVGAVLVVGLPLDRWATGPVHQLADPPNPPGALPAPTASKGPRPSSDPALYPRPSSDPPPTLSTVALQEPLSSPSPQSLARDCVAAAWRASGLGVDDSRLDSMISRARASAVLPETRLRAMRLWDDASHTTTLTTTDGMDYYDAIGANLVLELRLTWRLDRLVFAGDEPTLERVRLERLDARSRLATRTLEGLFAWARARLDADEAAPGSHEETEARLRVAETEATLDVLTAGWFSDSRLRARGAPP
jgi:hypothetical protein